MIQTLLAELRAIRPAAWATLAAAALLGAFLYSHRDWRLHQTLYSQGARATGWVTSKDLVGGKNVDYAFRVGEKLYRGTGTAGYGNPAFSALSPDDEVIVFFLPSDPAVSALGDPKLRIEDQHRWMAWALILFVPGLLLALRAELRSHG